MSYSGQTALVLGLGESGLAMARWLAFRGARLRIADTRTAPERLPQLLHEVPDAEFIATEFTPELLDGVNFIALSPGLSPLKELREILPAAQAAGIPLWGEVELFAQALTALKEAQAYQPRVLAITGTNGKTTVTSLTGLLCQRAGLSTRVAGNISPAMLDVLREDLLRQTLPEVWVLELSSFQLHSCVSLQADAATVLNLSQDHLDWHGEMSAYAADKAKIFGPATRQVLNRDDALVAAMAKPGLSQFYFSSSAPQHAGDFGLLNEHDMQWLAYAEAEEVEGGGRRRKNQPEAEAQVKRLMPVDALQIRGQHNALNALAALALCRAIAIPFAHLLHGLRQYQGEAHRVEVIATVAGIEFIDDSKGTNVGATVAALKGLGQGQHVQKIVLIAGGEGKGQDFSPLNDPLARYVKHVCLIGKASDELAAIAKAAGVSFHQSASLTEAVQDAVSHATSGDMVLLSPACASLDMFRNYAHRAEVFAAAVREYALDQGEVS